MTIMVNIKTKVIVPTVLLILVAVGLLSALTGKSPQTDAASLPNTALKWNTQTAAGAGGWRSVTWSPSLGRYVAVGITSTFPNGSNQRIMTSSNARTWALVGAGVPATPGVWTSVEWSPDLGLYAVVACSRHTFSTCGGGAVTNLRMMTSPDGLTWTERATPDTDSTWQSITWSPELDLFVAVADSGTNSIMTSPDGSNWTARTAPEDNAWKAVTWSSELSLFVAVSGTGTNRVMTSPDGVNWTARAAAEANTWTSVVYSPELNTFVAVASDGTNRVMTSPNGINWTARTASTANAWSSVTWSADLSRFLAVANSGTNRVMTSPDGITWTGQAASVDNAWNAVMWSPSINAFVAVASTGGSGVGTPRVMTGAMITASTNDPTSIADRTATLHGEYSDSFPGANVFFRYRVAGSGNPFTETTPQALASSGAFSASISGLDPDNADYEYKAVVQWTAASGTATLEGGLQTFATLYADDDNDGIYNVIEDAGPNDGDANNDGTPDSTQLNVVSFVNPITNDYVALEVDGTCQIDAANMAVESSNVAPDQNFSYPVGLMNFTVDCGTPGFDATIIQYYSNVTNDNFVFRKYNPNSNIYSTVSGATIQQDTISSQPTLIVTYQVIDGGSLDIDGVPNGTIVDPVGLALAVSTSSPVNSTGGELANTGHNQNLMTYLALTLLLLGLGLGAVVWNREYAKSS